MKDYVSFSAWCSYEECEAQALAKEKGEITFTQTEAMLVSSFMEMMLLEPEKYDDFIEKNPDVLNKRIKEPTLKKVYLDTIEAAETIYKDETFMTFLMGDKQVELTGTINGVKVLGYADVLNVEAGFGTDFKYVKDFNRAWNPATKRRESFIEQRKYAVQVAIYRELCYQKYGKYLDFYIAGATKEDVPRRVIAKFSDANYESSLDSFAQKLPRIVQLRKGEIEPTYCGKCEYCARKLDAPIISYRHVGMTDEEILDTIRFQELGREED